MRVSDRTQTAGVLCRTKGRNRDGDRENSKFGNRKTRRVCFRIIGRFFFFLNCNATASPLGWVVGVWRNTAGGVRMYVCMYLLTSAEFDDAFFFIIILHFIPFSSSFLSFFLFYFISFPE